METQTIEKTKVIHAWQNLDGTISFNNQIYADIRELKTSEGILDTQKVYVYTWTLQANAI